MQKNLTTIMALTIFLTALAVSSVRAQQAGNMAVTIPFDFEVSGKTLPAGDYYLERSTDGARVVMKVRAKYDTEGIYLPQTHPIQDREIQSESKLVFNKYENQFFLSQVWIAGRTVGQELAKTGKERALQRESARHAIKPESIAITGQLK